MNGPVGSLRSVYFDEEKVARVLIIEFEDYTGPMIIPNFPKYVPVFKSERVFELDKKEFRVQFPIVLAYSMKIHKSQGPTMNKVYIDIGDKEFSLRLTYVALSRVKRYDCLFLKGFSFTRYSAVNQGKAFEKRLVE